MNSLAPAGDRARSLSRSTKLSYGVGAVAFGVKDNGFSAFVLIFYNQVLGLSAAKVGLAIMIALIVDALADPVIGQVSDNWRSRWGRRHPFMYAAAIPAAAAYVLLWRPPENWGSDALFAYLVGVAILIRVCISVFEIPSTSLAAELTGNYDERTRLISYRTLFGWVGGTGTAFLALSVFFRPDATHPNGQLNPAGYALYGLVGAGLILAATVGSALGTHKEIPFLRAAPTRKASVGVLLHEMVATLSHASFLRILSANLFVSTAWGIISSLNLYFSSYFWEFAMSQMALLTVAYVLGAVFAFGAAPPLSERFGKKPAAMIALPVGISAGLVPILLRLAEVFPPNGSAAVFPLIFGQIVVSTACIVTANILIASMIADVVEDSELTTGRRSEGLFFAATAFVAKAVTGIGIFGSGMLLSLVQFPQGAQPGEVSADVIRTLGLVYAPTLVVLTVCAVLVMRGYHITRESHKASLRKLDAAAEQTAGSAH